MVGYIIGKIKKEIVYCILNVGSGADTAVIKLLVSNLLLYGTVIERGFREIRKKFTAFRIYCRVVSLKQSDVSEARYTTIISAMMEVKSYHFHIRHRENKKSHSWN
jgi:hypothetical protein